MTMPRTRVTASLNAGLINQIMPNAYYDALHLAEEVEITAQSSIDAENQLSYNQVSTVINSMGLNLANLTSWAQEIVVYGEAQVHTGSVAAFNHTSTLTQAQIATLGILSHFNQSAVVEHLSSMIGVSSDFDVLAQVIQSSQIEMSGKTDYKALSQVIARATVSSQVDLATEVTIDGKSLLQTNTGLGAVIKLLHDSVVMSDVKSEFNVEITLQNLSSLSLNVITDYSEAVELIDSFSLGVEQSVEYIVGLLLEHATNLHIPIPELVLFLVELTHGSPFTAIISMKSPYSVELAMQSLT